MLLHFTSVEVQDLCEACYRGCCIFGCTCMGQGIEKLCRACQEGEPRPLTSMPRKMMMLVFSNWLIIWAVHE